MRVKLPPYNPDAKCPKCGHDDIYTSYCDREHPGKICWLKAEREHLHRGCRRCHYEWLEACIDGSGEAEQAATAGGHD